MSKKLESKYKEFMWRARGLEANLRGLAGHRFSPPGIRKLADDLGRLIREVESRETYGRK